MFGLRCGGRRAARTAGDGSLAQFRRVSGRSGFSLVEVMCAILILGIAIAGLTQGITGALGSSKESELQTAAALIAAGRIETLRAEGYVIDGVEQGEFGEGLALYRWEQTITATSIDGLHEVLVVVENAKSGQTIYELRTLLFDPLSYSGQSESTRRRDAAASRSKKNRKR